MSKTPEAKGVSDEDAQAALVSGIAASKDDSADKDKASKNAFDDLIKSWVAGIKNSKRQAREIAELGMKHFHAHGDTCRLQLFLEAIEKHGRNYVRKAAFLKWCLAFSPITMDDGKLVKDKDRAKLEGFDPEMLEAALKEPFWDFAPDPENVSFTDTDVVKALNSVIAKYEKQRYVPDDEAAADKVVAAKIAIAGLSKRTVAVVPTEPEDAADEPEQAAATA